MRRPSVRMVHSPSITGLSDGSLAAVWYGGSREGGRDVQIYFSRLQPGSSHWSAAQSVVSVEKVTRDLGRYIKKLGNPVLHADAQGRLYLYFVSVSAGGWSGSALNYSVSGDSGVTWSPIKRLVTSPFANVSTLVRNTPINLSDEQILLPTYHEFAGVFSEMLILDEIGRVKDKIRMSARRNYLQPAVATLGDSSAIAPYIKQTE